MGTPIKDRGIRWEESYSDKSLYLKKQFEDQVGPGSYFRWEGHDSTSGSDYYAVVTPGFSKNHGYHFFAALRKIPADHGASGKKFKTQAEALSYAYDTWRVPPPKVERHKPYIAQDLQNKPIVMENVHEAEFEADMVKEAMGMQSSGFASGHEGVSKQKVGPNELWTDMFQRSLFRLIGKKGAAFYATKRYRFRDKYDQGTAGVFDPETGQVTHSIVPGMANPQPPAQGLWDNVMNPGGIPTEKPLIKVDRKKDAVTLIPPRHPNAENSESYSLKRFNDILTVYPTFKVAQNKKKAFDQIVQILQQAPNFNSRLKPGERLQIVSEQAPVKNGKPIKGNIAVTVGIPVDLFKNFSKILDNKKLAASRKMKWEDENAVELYGHFSKPENGGLATQEAIEKAMQTPVVETQSLNRGQLMAYDERGMPSGLYVRSSSKYEREGEDEGVPKIFFPFAVEYDEAGQVVRDHKQELLQQAGGDPHRLQELLANNQIELRREMFHDSRTMAPLTRNVYSMLPDVDAEGKPALDANGQIVLRRKSLDDDEDMEAPTNKVRVFNPDTNREEIQPYQGGTQKVRGIPVISSGHKFRVPVQVQDPVTGEAMTMWDEIPTGEMKLYDPKSKGKFKTGAAMSVIVGSGGNTSNKKGKRDILKKNIESEGIFAGYKRTFGDLIYREGGKIWDQHRAGLHSIITGDGRELPIPEDGNPNDPAMQHLNANGPISGYYYLTQRQYPAANLTSSADARIERKERRPDGTYGPAIDPATGQPAAPMEIKDDDIAGVVDGIAYYKSMKTAMGLTQAITGWPEATIGPWTDYEVDDLHAAHDLGRQVLAKQDAGQPLDEKERFLGDFDDAGNNIPQSVLQEFASMTGDPTEFEPEKGTIFKIQDPTASEEHLFATQESAQAFMQHMADYGVDTSTMSIIPVEDADLMVSAFKRRQVDPAAPVVQNILASAPAEQAMPEEPAPEAVPGAPEIFEPAQAPEDAAMPGDLEEAVPVPAAQAPEVEQPDLSVGTPEAGVMPPVPNEPYQRQPEVPNFWELPPEEPPAQQAPQPAPKPQPPLPPKPPPHKFWEASNSIDGLIKLADKLDDQGKREEANAIDRLIKMSLQTPARPDERK